MNDNIEKNIVRAFDKLVPNDSCRNYPPEDPEKRPAGDVNDARK